MYYGEPHLALNEKTWPIQWIEQPISALVAASSLGQFSQIWLYVKKDGRIF
jgi:hypothetical protein